jgi:hypothetical protein
MVKATTVAAGVQIRNKIMDFLNTGTDAAPVWTRMGKGFTGLDENPNAQVDTTAYINDSSASSTILGYQVNFPFNIDLNPSEAPINKIYEVGRDQLQGAAAEADYVRVEAFNEVSSGVFTARMFRVAIQVNSMTGAGAQKINVSGQLNNVGAFVDGTFDIESKTFTEAAKTA